MHLKALLLALVVPLATATIVINSISQINSDSPFTITFSSTDPADPPLITFELQNQIFNKLFAVANNIPTSQGNLTLVCPTVPPGDGYSILAVNISNVGDVFATFGPFSVGAAVSTTGSGTATGTNTGATTTNTLAATGTPTGTGTRTGTGTGVSVPTTTTDSGSNGSQTSTPSGSGTSFNNGAMHAGGPLVALTLSALAGITFLAL